MKIFLYPLSLIYGLVVYVRNALYDYKVLKSTEFEIPVIAIGNITVGGTGKTGTGVSYTIVVKYND